MPALKAVIFNLNAALTHHWVECQRQHAMAIVLTVSQQNTQKPVATRGSVAEPPCEMDSYSSTRHIHAEADSFVLPMPKQLDYRTIYA